MKRMAPSRRTEHRTGAPDYDHDHEFARLRPVQHVGADEFREIRHQCAGEPCTNPRDDERGELVLISRYTDRLEPTFILPHAAQDKSETRSDKPRKE